MSDSQTITTARDILVLWPNRAELARDLGRLDVTVRQWWNRNSIPGDADVGLVKAATRRGIQLTFEDLARTRASAAIPIASPPEAA
jgi:hypothetical protein